MFCNTRDCPWQASSVARNLVRGDILRFPWLVCGRRSSNARGTKKPCNIKVGNWIGRINIINDGFPLLGKETEKLTEREIVYKICNPIEGPETAGKGLKKGCQAKVKNHPAIRSKKPVTDPTKKNMCRLNGHTNL